MSDTPISAEEARRQALELSKAMLRGECSTFGDEVPMAEAIVSYAVEVERLRGALKATGMSPSMVDAVAADSPPAPCPAGHGDQCCGYPVVCVAAALRDGDTQ